MERCGQGTLFPVLISSEIADGTRTSYLNIVSGNDAKIAWRVSLGATESVRSTPMIHDIDDDGMQEIIVVYDGVGVQHRCVVAQTHLHGIQLADVRPQQRTGLVLQRR